MLFVESRFFLFFLVAFSVYWFISSQAWRKRWLLLCSNVFYAAWDWRFLSLIWISTVVDYGIGRLLSQNPSRGKSKILLMVSLLLNLGILGVFKYFDFFLESAVALGQEFGLDLTASRLHLVLPVGISFYTFQTLSYTIDVYRGQMRATKSFLDFALFVAFFPQLVAGPIVRARDFLPQLKLHHSLRKIPFRRLLTLFLIGYVKKACLADQVATVVDPVFASPELASTGMTWLGVSLYAVQIYGDFSGYSDMAIACAGLLGYELRLNFNSPYRARSVTDFWRRWHISLSSWFRDYLYVPLGGNQRGRLRTLANLSIVFVLCGLWHGAAWTFVLWGIHHGLFLVLERLIGFGRSVTRKTNPLAILNTSGVVLVGWVFFRAESVGESWLILGNMIGLAKSAGSGSVELGWALVLVGFIVAHSCLRPGQLEEKAERLPSWTFAALYGTAVAIVLPFAATGDQPFIYFQF